MALAERYLDNSFFTGKTRRSLDRNDFRPPEGHEAELRRRAHARLRLGGGDFQISRPFAVPAEDICHLWRWPPEPDDHGGSGAPRRRTGRKGGDRRAGGLDGDAMEAKPGPISPFDRRGAAADISGYDRCPGAGQRRSAGAIRDFTDAAPCPDKVVGW